MPETVIDGTILFFEEKGPLVMFARDTIERVLGDHKEKLRQFLCIVDSPANMRSLMLCRPDKLAYSIRITPIIRTQFFSFTSGPFSGILMEFLQI